jgi:hypothetical protein
VKIGSILDQIDLGAMALPEFQRGYVWSRPQVRGLMSSLYRRHPVGSLLIWKTSSDGAAFRGDQQVQEGYVSLLLDGQQRMTSLYGLIRGEAPPFFEGNAAAFTDLRFNLETETFEFYAPVKMRDDPLWVDVTPVLKDGTDAAFGRLNEEFQGDPRLGTFFSRLQNLFMIKEIDLHTEEVTGEDKSIDVVVDIFNRVNSGGTKLSKGDLALARICVQWPEAREQMHATLKRWSEAGFDEFKLDWLLRNVNAVINDRAELSALSSTDSAAMKQGLLTTEKAISKALNLIASRLGLDHARVLGGRGAFPVLSRFLAERELKPQGSAEVDALLYWYVHSFLWGRYAGSTETVLNQDLEAMRKDPAASVPALITQLEQSRGDLLIRPNDFVGWSIGARFYPLLYMLTRVCHARDWGSGLELRQGMLGKQSALELHHIFPKALLYREGYSRQDANALGNFTFLTMETNGEISDANPSEYLPRYIEKNPGVIESHWIPMDPELWRVENYPAFLEARRELLAKAANEFLDELRGGLPEPVGDADRERDALAGVPITASASSDVDDESRVIEEVNRWVEGQGFPRGELAVELIDEGSGEVEATLDLAWPDGLQTGLSQPLALLLNEDSSVEEAAGRHGFRFFTSADRLQRYVEMDVLDAGEPAQVG